MLNIIQKKGVPNPLHGRLLAYARILPGPPGATADEGSFPWEEMVHNGLLVVSGEFKTQQNLGDFLRKEFKGELGEGIEGLAQKLREMGEDLPEDMSPEEIRERLEGASHMDIIPVPAKVVTFKSEEAILAEDADIFYIGEFQGVQHAHLAVTSFPILYQAMYREQQSRIAQSEINNLLDQILIATPPSQDHIPPHGDPVILELHGVLSDFKGNLFEFLTRQVIPNLVYNQGFPAEFHLSMQNFRLFMKPYRWPADLDAIEDALRKLAKGDHTQNKHIELLCEKISAIHHEEFEKIALIQAALGKFG